jgi:hypothetical protein
MIVKFEKGRAKFEGDDAVKFGYLKGTCKWAHILDTDLYGKYSIDLYGEEVEEHIPEFEEMRDAAYDAVIAEGKKVAGKADVYKVNDDTGEKYIHFKLDEVNFKGEPNKIKIYDVTGKEVTDDWDKLIGNGSLVKIKYKVSPYYMASTKMVGVSYKFYAIQVIKLEEYAPQDKGFGDESDGSEAPFDTDSEY